MKDLNVWTILLLFVIGMAVLQYYFTASVKCSAFNDSICDNYRLQIMNIYLISQDDTYDSAVVAAKNETDARNIHPDGDFIDWNDRDIRSDWCSKPESVHVELLGKAIKGTNQGVICASYNAG